MIQIYQKESHSKFIFNGNNEAKKLLTEKFMKYDQKLEHTILVKRRLSTPHVYFFNEEHDFLPTGLLPFARVYLKKAGYDFEVIDLRKQIEPDLTALDAEYGEYILRERQIDAMDAIAKYGGGIIEIATGGGKGLILCALTKMYPNSKILCLFDSIDLILQTRKNFLKYGFDESEIGVIQGANFEDDKRITLLSMLSYEKAQHLFSEIDVIIADEAHITAKAPTAEKIFAMCQNAPIRIGLTATPTHDNEADKTRMFSLVGPVVYRSELKEQIEEGNLADVQIDMYRIGEDTEIPIVGSWNDIYDTKRIRNEEHKQQLIDDGYDIVYEQGREKARRFEEYGDESLTYIYNEERNKLIAEVAKKNKRVLILYDKKAQGRELLKYLPEATLIDGDSKAKDREDAKELFKKEDTIVLASSVWFTGIDAPFMETIIMANSSVSTIRVIQKLGRVVRKNKESGKETALCIDFLDKFNPLAIKQSNKRLRIYRDKLGLNVRIIEE